MTARPTREGEKGAWMLQHAHAHAHAAPLVSWQAAAASPDPILRPLLWRLSITITCDFYRLQQHLGPILPSSRKWSFPRLVACAYNFSIWEAETGGLSWLQSQPGILWQLSSPTRAAKEKKGREREKGEREQAPKEPCEDRSITSKC